MNRDEWEFEYTCAKLSEAANAQKEHRLARVKAWTEKKGEVMQKIKDSGLNVHESVAEQFANYGGTTSNAGFGAQITVDTTLQRDLSECVTKIASHRAAATEYDGWIQMLNANPEARVKLTHDDWMFFFGKR